MLSSASLASKSCLFRWQREPHIDRKASPTVKIANQGWQGVNLTDRRPRDRLKSQTKPRGKRLENKASVCKVIMNEVHNGPGP